MSSPQHGPPQRTIAHYRITAKIGEGGMGEVYRATDGKLGRDVAIKVLPSALASDADRMARFAREAQVLASLNHPNIASIYGVEDGALIMELIEGPTLDQRIAQGPVATAEARQIVNQLIEALEYAHEHGVVHRDLKPANIKIAPEDRVKILDFGLAKALSAERQPGNPTSSPTMTIRSTQAGMILGSAAYMAPEQARGHEVDKRADIWAFGVIVYEMLTQRQLFAAETVSDTIAQVLMRDFDLDGVSADFELLLERCLVRDRRLRLRDIGDARWLLERKTSAVPPPSSERAHAWPLWASIAGIAVLVACAFAYLWWQSPGTQNTPVRFALEIRGTARAKPSPDGKWILETAAPLRVRAVDNTEWRTLPYTEGASDAFWSADSAAIAFFADGRLKTVGADGRTVANLAAAPFPSGGSWRGGAKDGTVLFSSDGRLHTVDVASGAVRQLPLRGEPGELLREPVFLPEGNGFVYLAQSADGGSLYRAAVDSEKGEKLLDTERAVVFAPHPRTRQWFMFHCDTSGGSCELMVTPVDPKTGAVQGPTRPILGSVGIYAGRRIISLEVARNGLVAWRPRASSLPVWRMRWFDHNGNIVGSLGEPSSYNEAVLSPDETRVATSQGHPTRSVWLFDSRTGTGARVSSMAGNERNPRWSPDGKVLYYVNRSDDAVRIMAVGRREGTQPEVVYSQKGLGLVLHQVTPDGDYVLFSSTLAEEAPCGVYRLRVRTEKAAQEKPECFIRTQAGPLGVVWARVIPNGKWIIYRTATTLRADRYPRLGSAPIELDNEQGAPVFSADGSTLYRFDGLRVIARSVLASDEKSFRLGEPKNLFPLLGPQSAGAQPASVSRDGSRILAVATDQPESVSMQIATDWTAFLDASPVSK